MQELDQLKQFFYNLLICLVYNYCEKGIDQNIETLRYLEAYSNVYQAIRHRLLEMINNERNILPCNKKYKKTAAT